MPVIFHENINPHDSCCVWHITETEESLFERVHLSETEKKSILSLPLAKRRKERIACRNALAFLLKTPCIQVDYGNFGEPLTSNAFISFSHSGDYAAVTHSNLHRTGIDIEKVSDKILNLHSKFINDYEKDFVDLSNATDITRIWCAKEAIYKLFTGNNIDFLCNITVDKSYQSATLRLAEASFQITLNHWLIDDMIMVVALLP